MNRLSVLEKNIHSVITQYPFGKSFSLYHFTVLSIIPLAGTFFYFNKYKTNPLPPERILPLEKKPLIKVGVNIIDLSPKKVQGSQHSFLPKETSREIPSAEQIQAAQKDKTLSSKIAMARESAFQRKFQESKELLKQYEEELAREENVELGVSQEINRLIHQEMNFIEQLAKISQYCPLEPLSPFKNDYKIAAKDCWTKAMKMLLEKENCDLVDLFSLIEIGLSKGWFTKDNQDFYKNYFIDITESIKQHLASTWMFHLLARVEKAIESGVSISIPPITIPVNEDPKKALLYLSRLMTYFHHLGNHETSLQSTSEAIFDLLSKYPLEVDGFSKIFRHMLSCFSLKQGNGIVWMLDQMKNVIEKNPHGTIQDKIELLLIILNDLTTLDYPNKAKEVSSMILSLIRTMPSQQKIFQKIMETYHQLGKKIPDDLINNYNQHLQEKQRQIFLIQSISFGVLTLFTLIIRPLCPVIACAIVPLIPSFLKVYNLWEWSF